MGSEPISGNDISTKRSAVEALDQMVTARLSFAGGVDEIAVHAARKTGVLLLEASDRMIMTVPRDLALDAREQPTDQFEHWLCLAADNCRHNNTVVKFSRDEAAQMADENSPVSWDDALICARALLSPYERLTPAQIGNVSLSLHNMWRHHRDVSKTYAAFTKLVSEFPKKAEGDKSAA